MADAVVIQTAYLGDVVLTTPLLEAAARRHGPVDVVTTPAAAPLVETSPAVARVLHDDKHGTARGLRGWLEIARRLSARRCRHAYLPHASVRSALLARAARIPRRVGFDDAPGRWWYTECRRRHGEHEVDRLLALLDGDTRGRPRVVLTTDDHATAAAVLRAGGVEPPFIVVAPGSVRPTKRWRYFGELVRRISTTHGVAVVGAREDATMLERLSVGPAPVADLAGRLSLRESAAVMARAALALTNDSAPMHLASAVDTPVVALFGPTTPALGFGPRGAHDAVVQLATLGCRPCSTHGGNRCPLGHHRCMRDLDVDTVFDRISRSLAAVAARPPIPGGGR